MISEVKIDTQCRACGAIVTLPIKGPPIVNNFVEFSQVIIPHPGQVICPGCGILLTAAIAALQGFAITAVAVPKEEEKQIIIPGGPIQ